MGKKKITRRKRKQEEKKDEIINNFKNNKINLISIDLVNAELSEDIGIGIDLSQSILSKLYTQEELSEILDGEIPQKFIEHLIMTFIKGLDNKKD